MDKEFAIEREIEPIACPNGCSIKREMEIEKLKKNGKEKNQLEWETKTINLQKPNSEKAVKGIRFNINKCSLH